MERNLDRGSEVAGAGLRIARSQQELLEAFEVTWRDDLFSRGCSARIAGGPPSASRSIISRQSEFKRLALPSGLGLSLRGGAPFSLRHMSARRKCPPTGIGIQKFMRGPIGQTARDRLAVGHTKSDEGPDEDSFDDAESRRSNRNRRQYVWRGP